MKNMNFVPSFYQLLSSVAHDNQSEVDVVATVDSVLDQIDEERLAKRKSIPQSNKCWVGFDHWNKKQTSILVIAQGKLAYKIPKVTTLYPNYKGPLLEIECTSTDYLKPSSYVYSKGSNVKAKELLVKGALDQYKGQQIIENINIVSWEGSLFSLSFDQDVLLPIKYGSDYILIPCLVN